MVSVVQLVQYGMVDLLWNSWYGLIHTTAWYGRVGMVHGVELLVWYNVYGMVGVVWYNVYGMEQFVWSNVHGMKELVWYMVWRDGRKGWQEETRPDQPAEHTSHPQTIFFTFGF